MSDHKEKRREERQMLIYAETLEGFNPFLEGQVNNNQLE